MRTPTTAAAPKAASRAPKAPDAIALLKEDHREVAKLFAAYDKLGDGAKATKLKLVRQICLELLVHMQVEEEILYPAMLAELPREEDLHDEALVEHEGAKSVIALLQSMEPGDAFYDARVKVLSEYIEHHVKEEHEEVFPKLQKSALDLREIGMRLAFRKAELLARA